MMLNLRINKITIKPPAAKVMMERPVCNTFKFK